jgi:hypothetical protein
VFKSDIAHLLPTSPSDVSSELGYAVLKEQYTAAWEEAYKSRMFLPSRGEGGIGAYGVCDNKNEVSTLRTCVFLYVFIHAKLAFIEFVQDPMWIPWNNISRLYTYYIYRPFSPKS